VSPALLMARKAAFLAVATMATQAAKLTIRPSAHLAMVMAARAGMLAMLLAARAGMLTMIGSGMAAQAR
jgi:hypothetical protein